MTFSDKCSFFTADCAAKVGAYLVEMQKEHG